MISKIERQFYEKCLSMGIEDLSTKADIERAKLIAKNIGFTDFSNEETLKLCFNKIKSVIDEEQNIKDIEEKQAELNEIKAMEQEKEACLTKYAGYFGRDKQIVYYTDLLKKAQEPLDEYNDSKEAADTAKLVYNALSDSVEPQYKRKQDWSIAGGIASGLAGSAAGISIASDIQRKNAEIDEYNRYAEEQAKRQKEEFRKKGSEVGDSFMEKYNSSWGRETLKRAREQVKFYNEKIEKVKIKLLEERDPVELLAMLSPTVKSVSTTETGTVESVISVDSCNVKIFEEVNAVIDGSFSAVLWDDDDNFAGEIVFVLPFDGSAEKQSIKGMCTSAKHSKNYRLEFIKPKLWLIESDTQTSSENKTVNINFSKIKADYELLMAYYQACKLYDTDSLDNLVNAISSFKALNSFRKSKEKSIACKDKIYNLSLSKLETGKVSDDEEAIAGFKAIEGWKDSKVRLKEAQKNSVYDKAVAVKNEPQIGDSDKIIENLNKAAELFKSVSDWKDAENQVELCRKEIEEIKAKQKALEQEKAAEEAKKKRRKKILSISIPSAVAVVVTFVILLNAVIIPYNKYNQALEYINNEDYINANLILRDLGDYKDSNQLIIDFRNYISAGAYHTVGLKSDGAVVATGDNEYGQCDVSGWSDIVAISAGGEHTVGLKSDGTVVATGDNEYGQCDVSGWYDIVAVSAGKNHTVGLKSDGTVVATGANKHGQCDVSSWKDIVAVSGGIFHTVGLKSDGTVVATGDNEYGQCDVSGWYDIVAVSAGKNHTVGLKSDGTVVATGANKHGQCDVSSWKDIVAVSGGIFHTVGLKSDGTVVATGANYISQCNVSGWRDIVAVSARSDHTVGLKSDGTFVATGSNSSGRCIVSDWKLW